MLMFKTCLKMSAIGKCAKLCFNSSVTAILTPVKPQTIIFRNFNMVKKFAFKPNHYWDKIPGHFTMIYSCQIRHWIQGIQAVPLLFGALWLCYGINFDKINTFLTTRDHIIIISVFCLMTACCVYFGITASRYIMGIYHHEGQFVAVRRSFLGRLKHLHYNLNDVACKLKKGLDYHNRCDITIKNTKFHLVAADFISPMYYNMHLNDGTPLYTNTSTRVISD